MALAISVIVHAFFFLVVFGTLRGAAVSGGGGDPRGERGVVTLSLAGLPGAGRPAGAPPSQTLEALFRRIRAEQSDLAAGVGKPRQAGDLQKLFDLIDRDRAAADGAAGSEGRSRLDRGGRGAAADGPRTQAPDARSRSRPLNRAGGVGAAASTGDLWGQIKPCWDSLPPVATVPVILVVTLDDRGLIATPPRIVRSVAQAPDERRLISEARALTAVTACVPYKGEDLSGGRKVFEVRFSG